MAKLRLFTSPTCPKCPKAKKVAEEVVKSVKGLELEIIDLSIPENLITALMHQVASTPSFVINGMLIIIGEAPTYEELMEKVKPYISNHI